MSTTGTTSRRRTFRFVGAVVLAALVLACAGERSRSLEEQARLRGHVAALATRIGPRPAGSPGDVEAQEYVRRQMAALGLKVQVEPFDRVLLAPGTEVRVASANVVGTSAGPGDGAILVGSHHDSRNDRCPGASDDASGVAVMLEAARILSRRPHRSTLIFASFGGEETHGLPGSRAFLKGWSGPPIRLEINLDFVGSGRVFIAPFPVPPALWANRMLARAERKARTGLVSFDPWLVIVPKLIPIQFSADHVSFLDAGVPALNLSCEFPAWTYHTSEDRERGIDGRTLLAARDLVVRMVEEADSRRPSSGAAPEYLPLVLFGFPLFLGGSVLRLAPILVLLLALATLVRFRREMATLRGLGESLRGVLISVPLAALAVSGGFLCAVALGRFQGVWHPGNAHPVHFLSACLLASAFTVWLALDLARFLRPGDSPGAYLAPAILLEGILGGACLILGRVDVAFPFVLASGAMLLAAWSLHAQSRFALGILGAAPLLPFLSPTTYRMFLELSGVAVPARALEIAAGVLALPWFLFLLHLTCLPECLYARPGGIVFRPATGMVLAVLAVGGAWASGMRPAYDAGHQVLVTAREEIDLSRRRAEVRLSSLESLRPVRLDFRGMERLPDAPQAEFRVPFPARELPGLDLLSESDGEGGLRILIRGSPPGDPRWIGLEFRGEGNLEVERNGSWSRVKSYRLVLFPHGAPVDEVLHLRKEDSAPLTVEGVLSYDSDLLKVSPRAPFHTFRTETRVRFRVKVA